MALRIAVCGPTGSGKTTLARALGSQPGVALVEEPQPQDLLVAFAKQPHANCYALEAAILRGRAANARACGSSAIVVFDRTVSEDLAVFVALHHRRGFREAEQVEALSQLTSGVEAEIGTPDVHVFLTADRDLLCARLAKANPPPAVLESLNDQLALYQQWHAGIRGARVVVDTSQRAIDGIEALALWILETAPRAVHGAFDVSETLKLAWRGANV